MKLRQLAFCAITAATFAAAPRAATAAPIVPFTFSTSGTFTAAGGATIAPDGSLDFGTGLFLRFNPAAPASYFADVATGPGALNTIVPLGSFDLFSNVPSFTSLPSGNQFALTITQTNPSSPNGTFSSTLSGSVIETPDAGGGSVQLVFAQPTNLNLGGIDYRLLLTGAASNTLNLSVPSGAGVTSNTDLEAAVTAVPEPGSIMLFGTGLFGLAGIARRRFGRFNVA